MYITKHSILLLNCKCILRMGEQVSMCNFHFLSILFYSYKLLNQI